MKRRVFLLFAAACLSACATTDTLEPGTGTTFEVRGRSYDQIWKAVAATASRQLTIVEQNKDAGVLKAESRVGLTTFGEVVGIFIKPAKSGSRVYTVEVQSQKRSKVQLTGQDWTQTMVTGIKSELGI